jgi:hypothetical protein
VAGLDPGRRLDRPVHLEIDPQSRGQLVGEGVGLREEVAGVDEHDREVDGEIRVARCSITAAWAPKLVLRTSASPKWAMAQAILSPAGSPDSLRSTAAGSTAAERVSAVGII